jgi:hypothetical protein
MNGKLEFYPAMSVKSNPDFTAYSLSTPGPARPIEARRRFSSRPGALSRRPARVSPFPALGAWQGSKK